eukprot:CAMPEP_0204634098 /NCGR_PEP_ID=MMETSP0717-20131115/28490_1 /ASSEMBLY_ACC=CAM_ASM_000666 /TAXON_ID=230516 /ORGANISM="Chaetoceros curvisetus" /LENGTH=53 /DNA_ID=CAMNT_0051652427 /DNA_START=139 /DNA_END=300 /DNA_ORIENTATION=-
MAIIADGGGPMKVIPASMADEANVEFSDRKPYPGCIACAPVAAAMLRTSSPRR